MSKRAIGHSPKMIQNVFVLLLLSLFAILSTFLVTVGAQLYRNTVESSEKNNAIRIVTTVLRSTIWAEDGGDGEIEVEEFELNGEKVKVLSIIRKYGDSFGDVWVKRVYAYNGSLQEGYTEYFKTIKRKELKAGQQYLELEENADEDEFREDELESPEESASAEDAESDGMFEKVINSQNAENNTNSKYPYKTASKDGGDDGDPDDYVYVHRGFVPGSDGEPLCDLIRFEPSWNGRKLAVEMETTDHQTSTVRMTMRSGGAE